MEIIRCEFSKRDLSQLTEDEQTFFVNLGVLHNDMNILLKTVLYSLQEAGNTDVEQRAKDTQVLLFIRLLCGVMFEGWIFIERYCFKDKNLFHKYYNDIKEPTKDALCELGNYFSAKNNVEIIRNKYSFHYQNTSYIKSFISALDDDERLSMYISKKGGNHLSHYSDVVMSHSLKHALKYPDDAVALSALEKEILDVRRWINNIARGFTELLSEKIHVKVVETAHIKVRTTDDVVFPYFTRPSDRRV